MSFSYFIAITFELVLDCGGVAKPPHSHTRTPPSSSTATPKFCTDLLLANSSLIQIAFMEGLVHAGILLCPGKQMKGHISCP